MCGIAGLFLKQRTSHPELGRWFAPMLRCLTSRGPDSAGIALYRPSQDPSTFKVTLQNAEPGYDWAAAAAVLAERFTVVGGPRITASHAVIRLTGDLAGLRAFLQARLRGVQLMSIGRSVEIYKEMGSPGEVCRRFAVEAAAGSHAIGHTRMATESAVSTAGSHPFSTGIDLCLVHNGSLSNHNRLRLRLRRAGIAFETDNDSEVAAGYLTWRMREGANLRQALESALRDLDGFYTFAVGTAEGFAVLRDPIACKPAVLAETDRYVAMASEFRSLAHLPDIDRARLWEPEPATVYEWNLTA